MKDNKLIDLKVFNKMKADLMKERQYSSNIRDEFVNLYNDIVNVITVDGEEKTDGECVDDLWSVLDKYKDIDEWQVKVDSVF